MLRIDNLSLDGGSIWGTCIVHARSATGRCAHAKQEDKPRRRLGQLRQRERLSLTNRTQRERLPLTNRTRGS